MWRFLAYTVLLYSKDLAAVVLVATSSNGLNVLWLALVDETGNHVWAANMSWNKTGASACKIEMFQMENGGREVPEIKRVHDGVWFNTDEKGAAVE